MHDSTNERGGNLRQSSAIPSYSKSPLLNCFLDCGKLSRIIVPRPPTSRGTYEVPFHPCHPVVVVIHPGSPRPTDPPNPDHSLNALKGAKSLNYLRPNVTLHYLVRQDCQKFCFYMGFFIDWEISVRCIVVYLYDLEPRRILHPCVLFRHTPIILYPPWFLVLLPRIPRDPMIRPPIVILPLR
jgi:hypothetical protein